MTEILPGAQFLSVAPGRVNLLGEHLDYNGGGVLPIAIDRQVRLAFTPREGDRVSIRAIDLDQQVEFSLNSLDQKVTTHGKPLPGWAWFPAGIAWALRQHGLPINGMEAAFTSDIPIGAGLSSSAAVEVAFAAAWQEISSWSVDQMTLARLCQKAENDYVGVACGLMDQFASVFGQQDHALYFDTRDESWQKVPLPQGTVIVVADSGLRRSLTGSGYNQRRQDCETALSLLQKHLPGIQYLADVSRKEFDRWQSTLPAIPRKRARHVIEECARVKLAVAALQKGDAAKFGQLMLEGHISLRDDFEVSTPELDALVDVAKGLPGCFGSRLTGAGFGGCTVSLVDVNHADGFMEQLKAGYLKQTCRQAKTMLCHAGSGVHVETLEG